jgi:predicted ABC-class ATPase
MSTRLEALLVISAILLLALLGSKAWHAIRARRLYAESISDAKELQQFLLSKNKELAGILNNASSDIETRRLQADVVIAQMQSRDTREDPGLGAFIADTRAYVLEVLGSRRAG